MQAADVGHDIERLVALLGDGPRIDPGALLQVEYVLAHLERGASANPYKLEKIAAVRGDFRNWLGGTKLPNGSEPSGFKIALTRDIEHLRKAFARGSQSQD